MTGAASGIGRVTAQMLKARGVRLALKTAAQELDAYPAVVDVSRYEQVLSFFLIGHVRFLSQVVLLSFAIFSPVCIFSAIIYVELLTAWRIPCIVIGESEFKDVTMDAHATNGNKGKMPDFLTPEREYALQKGINDAIQDFRTVATSSKLFKDYSKRGLANLLRNSLDAGFKQAFAGVDGVEILIPNNMFLIVFDKCDGIFFRKALDPETLIAYPKTLLKVELVLEAVQLRLFDDTEVDTQEPLRINDLRIWVGLYIPDGANGITSFYVNEQDGQSIVSSEEILLSQPTIHHPVQQDDVPEIEFKFRAPDGPDGGNMASDDMEDDMEDNNKLVGEK